MRVKDADFEFDNFFFNSVTRMPFLGKFGPKTQKGFVLNETWSIVVFEDADSKFDNCCHKFHPQNNFLVWFILNDTWYMVVFNGANSECRT